MVINNLKKKPTQQHGNSTEYNAYKNIFCSFTCACNSYDGSLKCCPGYYWNRIENRCTSKFLKIAGFTTYCG